MKRFPLTLAILAAVMIEGGMAQEGVDNIADVNVVFRGVSARLTGNNLYATYEDGEPYYGDPQALNSIWWKWEPEATGYVQIYAYDSEIDTVLTVISGSPLASYTIHVSSDYLLGQARIPDEFYAEAGTVYYISVVGVGGAEGNVAIGFRSPSSAPVNDSFSERTVLTSSTNVSVAGSNVNAVPEAGEQARDNVRPRSSIWWSWTAPTSCVMDVDTRGSSFDTVVGVYTGVTMDALGELVSRNDNATCRQARVWFPAVAGRAYVVAVDGANGGEGSVSLKLRSVVPATVSCSFQSPTSATMRVAWDTVAGEKYCVDLSTNLQSWSTATSLVASAVSTFVDVNRPYPGRCFSRVQRCLDP